MIEGGIIKRIAYPKEELINNQPKVKKPFTLTNNKIIIKDDIVKKYNLKKNDYSKLNRDDKFIVSKLIIDYYIDKNVYSRRNKICNQKKEYNALLNKTYKSKTKRIKQEEELENKYNIISFNERIIYKSIKIKDLLNDVYNNVLDNDYISLEENFYNLSKSIKSIIIPLNIDIISDFLVYINDIKRTHKKRPNKSFDGEYLEKFLFIDYDKTSSINKCSGYKK